MSSLGELRQLTRTRIVLFMREPEAVFWVVLFPVVLALVLSIAFKDRAVGDARVGILQDFAAEPWVERLRASEGIEVELFPSREAAERKLRSGALAALVEAGEPLTVRYDPSRAEAELARLRVEAAVQQPAGGAQPARVATLHVTEHGSRYIDFLIPGLVGLNLMGSGMWGIGFSVVVSRTRKLLKRFAVTPMRRGHYLLSFAFSRLIFLFLEVAAVVGFGWLVFGVRVRGSLLALFLVSLVGAMCFAGLGLLVAARPRSIEGVSGWMNLVMLPMWLLSGTFFSYERFPSFSHTAIRALPLTALNDALRAVVNDGTGLAASWPQLAVMAAWGICCFVLAVRIFRWQ